MGNNETTPLLPDSLLGRFTKPSESRISETTSRDVMFTGPPYGCAIITDGATSGVRPTFIYRQQQLRVFKSTEYAFGSFRVKSTNVMEIKKLLYLINIFIMYQQIIVYIKLYRY